MLNAYFLILSSFLLPSVTMGRAMSKLLIVGGRGYLGGHLKIAFPDAVMPSVDIADQQAVSALLDNEKPDIVINAAGKTGRPNVDWCETHTLETIRSNVTGPLVLLDECAKRSMYWVHIGSGCIYEGDNGGAGFSEEDEPNFTGSFYAKSKLWTDRILAEFPVLQLRLRMPFDGTAHERNLINKLKKYTKLLDVQNSITYLPDFVTAIQTLIDKRATGIYNVVNPGSLSPYDIMSEYQRVIDASQPCEPLSLRDLPSVVKTGRSNCILSSKKLAEEGLVMRPVQEALRLALEELKTSKP